MPKVQQFRKQTVQQKSAVPKSQLPKPPEMPTEPGKQDRICNAVHIGGLSLGAIVLLGSAYGISQAALKAIHQTPVDWATLVGMTLLTVVVGLVVRGIVWASFAGVVMLATHLKAWHAQDQIARKALKLKRFFPGGTSWAAQALLGQMVNRQQFKEVINFGTSEWESTKKKDQSVAPLCSYVGMAHQMQGDSHSAILWNERAVELFQKAMTQLEKVDSKTKVPNREFVDNMIMQYASAFANLGANYFGVGNYGKAKKNFHAALEQLNRVKDNSQKDILVRGINEHMARLKHW